MKFEDKKLDNGQGQWIVTIDGEQWTNALKKAKNFLSKNIEVDGFRKGKAPASEVEKQLTPVKIYNQAFQTLVGDAFDFALEQNSNIEPFTPPIPTPVKVDDSSLTISYTFELKPEIELGTYKGLKIDDLTKESLAISDAEVDEVLKQYQERLAMETVKPDDAKIADGDVVTFDFDGFIDGKPFAGGDAKNFKLEVGSHQFIPGFEEAMIGLGRGENQMIKVQFPEGYPQGLGGKDAEFKLNITEIAQKELPALDDELAKDLAIDNVTTLDQLKAKIKTDLEEQKGQAIKRGYVDRVLMEIIKNSKIILPKTAIDEQVKHLRADFERSVAQEGMDLKDYQKALGLTDEALDEQFSDDAKNELSTYLVTSKIAQTENLDATDAEVDAKFTEFSNMYGIEVEQLKTLIKPAQLRDEIVNDKIINFLYENN